MNTDVEVAILRASIEARDDDIVIADTPPLELGGASVAAIFALGSAHSTSKAGNRERAAALLEQALTESRAVTIRSGAIYSLAQLGHVDLARRYVETFLSKATETWEVSMWNYILNDHATFRMKP